MGVEGREAVGVSWREDSRFSLALCEDCIVYEKCRVYLMGDGNASIDVDGERVWNGSVDGHRKVALVLPKGRVVVEVDFEDDEWVWNLIVKNRSVEEFVPEEFGEDIVYVKMTELEMLMALLRVHGVTVLFFVLASPLMYWVVKKQKESEVVELV
jgi:hypothetical protein